MTLEDVTASPKHGEPLTWRQRILP